MPTPVKSNPTTCQICDELKRISKESGSPIWKTVAEMLDSPQSRWAEVNVQKLEDYAKPHSTIIVPGKLLGDGTLKKNITVTAFRFSAPARKKVIDAGGSILSLIELAEKHPKGAGVVIMK